MPKHPPSRRDSTSNINPNLNSGTPSSSKRSSAAPKRDHAKKEREVISVEDDDAQREAEAEMRARNIQPQQMRPTREQVQSELLVLHPHAPTAPPPGMIGYGHHDMPPPPGQYAQMNRGDPLRPFQNQFHTGWVQEEPVSLSGSPQPMGRERDIRERERDRERERRKPKPGKTRGEAHERDRDRERRERRSELMNMMYEPPVYMDRAPREMYSEKAMPDVVEWEREKEVRAKTTLHLGTHVYPRVPFPYFFDIAPGAEEKEKRVDTAGEPSATADFVEVDTETRATILIPSAHLPMERPDRPRVWGGGLVPPPGFEESRRRRNKDSDTRGRRRIYTDDSDLFTCALRVLRCAASGAYGNGKEELVGRFVGGPGERYHGVRPANWPDEDSDDEEGDGTAMTSAGWGTGHDGSAIELLNVEFVKGVVPALGKKNRSQRIAEYNERRLSVACSTSPSRDSVAARQPKRAWPGPLPNAIPKIHLPPLEAALQRECPRPPTVLDLEADRMAMEVRTVKLSYGKDGADLCTGFAYDPDVLREVLFPRRDERPAKRRRLDDDVVEPLDFEMTEAHASNSEPSDQTTDDTRRPITLETSKERYLLTPAKQGTYDLAIVVDGFPAQASPAKRCTSDGDTEGHSAPKGEASTSVQKPDIQPTDSLNGSKDVGGPSSNGEPSVGEPKAEGDGVGSQPPEARPKRANKRKNSRKEPPKYAVPPAEQLEQGIPIGDIELSWDGVTCRERRIPLVAWRFVPMEAS
ncbi:hypothetical protein HDZ31DRAFT_77817 [Schizophyllum fasciatum]